MAETPIRKIRIDDDTWQKLTAEARSNGETTSGLVRRILINYVKDQT